MQSNRAVYSCVDADDVLAKAKVAQAVQDVVALVRPILRPKDTGGVLVILPTPNLPTMYGAHLVGSTPVEEDYFAAFAGHFVCFTPEQSFATAKEKASRLFSSPEDVSAWQTRDRDNHQYGGAIVAGDLILAFSGFSEHGDEAVLLCAAWICGLISEAEITAIVAISLNPLFEDCYKKIRAVLYPKQRSRQSWPSA